MEFHTWPFLLPMPLALAPKTCKGKELFWYMVGWGRIQFNSNNCLLFSAC